MSQPTAHLNPRQVAWLTTTVDCEPTAKALAAAGVGPRLAACAQMESIHSTYWWNGELQNSVEWRITWKTTPAQLPALQKALQPLHPYDLPQWLHGQCDASPAYAQWVSAEVTAPLQV
ncbi:MAG: divalent-cation tolerance protein CutA [Comamonas sp.]|jgi:periplasmic divalent cation tolerance protein